MFIVTARIPKKRLLVGAATLFCCAVAVVTALILTLSGQAVTAAAEVSDIRSNDDRTAYLNRLGWQVTAEPLGSEELLIPETFDTGYDDYLALQSGQGFDLTQYCGKRVKRYTYRITNYPDDRDDVRAVLLIYKNRVVGGQIQSDDGTILHGLTTPAPSPAPSATA